MTVKVSEPGVYDGMSDADYHHDPVPEGSLSSSGARRLLPPSCPALFAYERQNPPAPKPQFDLGHGAHKLVLGTGPDLVEVEADDWRTKAAQTAKKEAHAEGKVPLLTRELAQVTAMAEAIRRHPIASALFDPERGGKAEQSLFWRDEAFDVWRRARLDWLPAATESGRIIIPDYKTTVSAEPGSIAKSMANYGYAAQAAWYEDAVVALGLTDVTAFVFVYQEKTPPYLVTVAEPDAAALRIGRALNQRALEVYAECTAANTWPGYTDDVALISLPGWYERQFEGVLT